ncbi:MAG: pentapeptide repeat-containing protein [Gallionella sp.]|nr:pentapeptide repeat-containing protein [Gallionella sp.]
MVFPDFPDKLRSSIDEMTKYVSNVYITYLLAGIYIAVAIASTTDKQLLLEGNLPLPLLSVELPIQSFYIVVPFAYLLFHLYLLVYVYFLSVKLANFEELLGRFPNFTQRQRQRNLLLPLAVSPLSVKATTSPVIRMVLRLIMWATVLAMPLILLGFAQLRFLPYHSVGITSWHRMVFALDVAIVCILWTLILGCQPKRNEFVPSRRERILAHLAKGTGYSILAASLAFSLVIVTVPEEPLDRITQYFDPIKQQLHRNLVVTNTDIVTEAPSPQLVVLYIQQGKTLNDAWREHAKGVVLKERDLRGGNFRDSTFYNAELQGARLDSANLESTNFQGADLGPAMRGKVTVPTSLREAKLFDADLRGAILRLADLRGADVSGARMQGTNLSQANLQGVTQNSGKALGPALAVVDLRGSSLFDAKLQAADLTGANIQGADMSGAHLQAANLSEANLKGVLLGSANLQGADLRGANLDLAYLDKVQLGALTLSDATMIREEFAGSDIDRGMRLSLPPQGSPTRFDAPSALQIENASFDVNFAMFTGIAHAADADMYTDQLTVFVVELACTELSIVKAIAFRSGFWTMRKKHFGPYLARALLKAEEKGRCTILRDIRADYREVLSRSAKAQIPPGR